MRRLVTESETQSARRGDLSANAGHSGEGPETQLDRSLAPTGKML